MHYRQIWEQHYKRKIPDGYEIHHIDGNRNNNDPSNLKCVSIEEHLEIHKSQKDWGAVQAILLRMENKEELRKAASLAQKKRLKEGTHNFQKISKSKRSQISKETHKHRATAFLGIDDTVENSRRAGLKAAEKKAGFLNTSSKNHGSKHVKGSNWWVSPEGKRKRSVISPGSEWQKGMKYESKVD